MNDTYITVNGNVAAEPRMHQFSDGSRVTSLRLAVTRRVYDRAAQVWRDGETNFFTVRCHRSLATNVAQSLRVGQPVIVTGKLRLRSFERDGERRFAAELEATSVGHDLKWGIAAFEKTQRGASIPALDEATREELESSTRDWELSARVGHAGPPAAHDAPLPGSDGPDAGEGPAASVGASSLGLGEGPGADVIPWPENAERVHAAA